MSRPSPALSPEALEHLADLLDEAAEGAEGMNLEMLDGFMSAIVVGPELVLPSEYQPLIWNGQLRLEPARAEELLEHVTAFHNHVLDRVGREFDPDDDEAFAAVLPIFALPEIEEEAIEHAIENAQDPLAVLPEDFPYAAAWATGFLQGVALRPDAWMVWVNAHEDFQDDLEMLSVLALFDASQLDEAGAESLPTLRERFEMTVDIPGMLHEMHKQRLIDARPRPARRVDGPGRNDPCPCGSGHKFKKCCGAPGHLH